MGRVDNDPNPLIRCWTNDWLLLEANRAGIGAPDGVQLIPSVEQIADITTSIALWAVPREWENVSPDWYDRTMDLATYPGLFAIT